MKDFLPLTRRKRGLENWGLKFCVHYIAQNLVLSICRKGLKRKGKYCGLKRKWIEK